jgi:hypothetical protein
MAGRPLASPRSSSSPQETSGTRRIDQFLVGVLTSAPQIPGGDPQYRISMRITIFAPLVKSRNSACRLQWVVNEIRLDRSGKPFRPRRSTPPHRDGKLIFSGRCHRLEIHQEIDRVGPIRQCRVGRM